MKIWYYQGCRKLHSLSYVYFIFQSDSRFSVWEFLSQNETKGKIVITSYLVHSISLHQVRLFHCNLIRLKWNLVEMWVQWEYILLRSLFFSTLSLRSFLNSVLVCVVDRYRRFRCVCGFRLLRSIGFCLPGDAASQPWTAVLLLRPICCISFPSSLTAILPFDDVRYRFTIISFSVFTIFVYFTWFVRKEPLSGFFFLHTLLLHQPHSVFTTTPTLANVYINGGGGYCFPLVYIFHQR
jgi:hypothetical protein